MLCSAEIPTVFRLNGTYGRRQYNLPVPALKGNEKFTDEGNLQLSVSLYMNCRDDSSCPKMGYNYVYPMPRQ